MGNSVGGRNRAKVMKMNGETFKLKSPATAWDVIKDYPGFVLLESGAVKQFGIRAKPVEPQQELRAKKVYFLVDLPKLPEQEVPKPGPIRRVQSAAHTSAKDRLESLMTASRSRRKSTSDMGLSPGPVRIKMRLPKAQFDQLAEQSKDQEEIAKKISDLYMQSIGVEHETEPNTENISIHRKVQLKLGLDNIRES